MRDFKTNLGEGLNKIRETGRNATDIGSEMNEQADQIRAILESIDLRDSEDIQGVSDTKNNLQESVDREFAQQVETRGTEALEQSEQVTGEAGDELGNVRSGIAKLEQASQIAEFGTEAANAGAARLEGSAGEYENIISETKDTSESIRQEIEDLKNNLGSVFG